MVTKTNLNDYFEVVKYDGGPIHGVQGITGLFKVSPGKTKKPVASKYGDSFDIVLRYTGPEVYFTLDNFVVVSPNFSDVTAPLKSGIIFVNDTDDVSYSHLFDDISIENYDREDFPDAPVPAAFFDMGVDMVADTCCSAIKGSYGKYLHIKFSESYGDDNNFDLGHFFIIGEHGKNEEVGVTQYSETSTHDVTQLRELNYMKYAPIPRTITPLHSDFADILHSKSSINLISTISISDALLHVEKGIASSDETQLVTLYNALSDVARDFSDLRSKYNTTKNYVDCISSLEFLSIDPSTSSSIVDMVLPFVGEFVPSDRSVTDGNEMNDVCESSDLPYGLPLSQDDDETLTTESKTISKGPFTLLSGRPFVIVAIDNTSFPLKSFFHEQIPEDIISKLTKIEIENDVLESLQNFVLSRNIVNSSDQISAPFTLVDELSLFTRAFSVACAERDRHSTESIDLDPYEDILGSEMSSQTRKMFSDFAKKAMGSEAVKPVLNKSLVDLVSYHYLTSEAPKDVVHPILDHVLCVTHTNFVDVVIHSDDNILLLVVDPAFKLTIDVAARLSQVSRLFVTHNVNLKIAFLDATTNDIPFDYHCSNMYDSFSLFIKSSGDFKNQECVGLTTKGQNVYSYKYMFDADVSSEERELLDEIDDDSLENCPTIKSILSFLFSTVPDVFPHPSKHADSKQMVAEADTIDHLFDDLNYCQSMTSMLLPSVASHLQVKYPTTNHGLPLKFVTFPPGSAPKQAVANLHSLTGRLNQLIAEVPYPVGKLPVPINGCGVEHLLLRQKKSTVGSNLHWVNLGEAVEDIAFLKDQIETCAEILNAPVQTFMKLRIHIEKLFKLISSFPDYIVQAISTSPFSQLGEALVNATKATGLFLTVPVIPQSVNDALTAHNQPIISFSDLSTDKVLFVPEDGLKYEAILSKCCELLTQTILEKVTKIEDEVYGDAIIRVKSDKQLQRVLEGYKSVLPPKAPVMGGRVKKVVRAKDEKVSDARNRLICLYTTEVVDGSVNNAHAIAESMRAISADYKSRIENGDKEAKNVVFVKMEIERFPSIIDILGIEALPTLVFIQDMGEAVDIRVNGADVNELPSLLKESIASMQDLDKFAHDDDMDIFEDEME